MTLTPLHAWIANRLACRPDSFSRTDVERWQLERLRWVLDYVHGASPYYRQILSDFSSPALNFDSFQRLPFTTPADMGAEPERFVCVSQEEIQRVVTLPTSGTTGPSKRVFFTPTDQELTIDFFKVGMSTLAKGGDRVVIFLPGERPGSVGDLLKTALERLGCSSRVHGPVIDEEMALSEIREFGANILVGSPVQLHRLAARDAAHPSLPFGQVRAVLTSTDTLSSAVRRNLEKKWGCEVFDHWGMTETGLGGAVECEYHQGFHLREADLFVEIIDPTSGRPLPDGKEGEVVLTTLTRTGMPLIRYRTGDVSRLLEGTCDCGSWLKRLGPVKRRLNSQVAVASAWITQNDLDEALFECEGLLDFKASVVQSSFTSTLTISAFVLGGFTNQTRSALLESLQSVTAIRTGCARERVEIKIEPWHPGVNSAAQAMAKRQIAVSRIGIE